MSPEAARAAHELQMLEGLVDCAYGLGMALGASAKAEEDTRRFLVLMEGFHKCSQAVRMGIRLCMMLRAPPRAAPAPRPSEILERPEALERERPERDPSEHEPLERERERDYEPVSLPKFLSTLGLVAKDAQRLGDQLPAAAADVLPRLQNLLAEAKGAPPPDPAPRPSGPGKTTGLAVLARPPQPATRRTLLGSAAPPRPGPRAPPRWPGSG